MAKQHFYSRVPARMSMFLRTDGFDTFAHSKGLDREFIEKGLAPICENKLNKNDLTAVRTGDMPVVYSQNLLKTGELVQSCIQYLPLDYTGERSAYLCHSLILEEDEKQNLFYSEKKGIYNPKLFVTSLDSFDLLGAEAAPNPEYPTVPYAAAKAPKAAECLLRYDEKMVKEFLFALFSALCAKGKNIFFKLPYPDKELSDAVIAFLGAVMQVIPYHLRQELSFVSFVTDPTQYGSVKLKGLASACPEVPASKGIFFDFHAGLVTGLPGEDTISKVPVNFFYSLLKDDALRIDFLSFVDRAVKELPALEKTNVKMLSDLVFLFAGSGGAFSHQTVLPTDGKIYDFLCVYEKYRDALCDEHRVNAYRCVERYHGRHEAIPKNIFAKLSKLYPTEVAGAKEITMRTVLDLIHTDVMRDKLFSFIRNNYEGEDAAGRAQINADLCRVFYGGFLQSQILGFFADHFATEPEDTQNGILEKLLLAIRTEAVQPKILSLLYDQYGVFTPHQKQLVYATIYEMLPECDGLSARLIAFLNTHVAEEPQAFQDQVAIKITELLDENGKKQDYSLLPLLCREAGFCQDVVGRLVFGPWNKRKAYDLYLEELAKKTVAQKTTVLLRATQNDHDSAAGKVIASLTDLYADNVGQATLYEWLEADTLASVASAIEDNAPVADALREQVIQPAVTAALWDVFDLSLGKDGMEAVHAYANDHPEVADSDQYQTITAFCALLDAIRQDDGTNAFSVTENLPQEPHTRAHMAGYIRDILLPELAEKAAQAALCEMCVNRLTDGVLLSDSVYTECKEICVNHRIEQMGAKPNVEKATKDGAMDAGNLILRDLALACQAGGALQESVCGDTDGLRDFITAFSADYGRGAEKYIASLMADAPAPLSEVVLSHIEQQKRKGNVLAKLFGKR